MGGGVYCTNENCPDRVRNGTIPEYRSGITICPVCSSTLEGDEPLYDPPDGAARRLVGNLGFEKRLFRRAPLIDRATAGWIIDTYQWFLENFGGPDHAAETQLVEPTEEFFPIASDADETARAIFESVRRAAGMDDWPCRLCAQDTSVPDELHPGITVVPEDPDPLGTFSIPGEWGEGATITYDRRLQDTPAQLVATFAHELAHYLLATARTAPPGGDEFEEPATDLGAVFLGFGVFACNAAFSFAQYSDGDWIGWRTSLGGYLGEDQLSFALALFLLVHELSPESCRQYLDPNPRGYLSDSLRQLTYVDGEIERLRALLERAPAAQQGVEPDVE